MSARESFALVDYNNPERLMQRRQISKFCWEGCSQLDPLEQEVLVRYFVYDEPLVTIARELKYCRCHISRVKSRALVKLYRLLGSRAKNFCDIHSNCSEEPAGEKRLEQAVRKHEVSYTGGRGRRRSKLADRKADQMKKALVACG